MRTHPLAIVWADWRGRLPYQRFLDREDRQRRLAAQACACLTLLAGSLYLAWLGRLVWRNPSPANLAFVAAEILAFLLLLVLALDLWRLRFHRPEGLEIPIPWSVDILVPCCGEPLEIIRTTLEAVARIHYQPVQVYVLDDAGSPQVATLVRSLGFHYHSRPLAGVPRRDAKGGNLNFGLSLSQGDLILVLDADQVPHPELLSRTVGFFRLPRVAYVQTRQAFFLPEGDPFYNRDEIFYEVVQLGNDRANAVISCGSGVIYRRQALTDMGGFATWNLVEDLTTSYELLSRGWKGLYFPYALSQGLAPATLSGVYRQRFQWCLDTMRLFFWDNPLLKRGLTRNQKLHFLVVMLSYLVSGLVLPIFYTIPLFTYWRGSSVMQGAEWQYLAWRGAYLGATLLMFRYFFYRRNALKQFKMLCGLFPVYAAAIFAALWYPPGRKPAYRVNNGAPFSASREVWGLAPQLAFILLHLTLPFLSLHLGWAGPKIVVFNALFSAFTIWVLADLVLEVVAKPVWRPALDPTQVYGKRGISTIFIDSNP